MCLTGFYDLLSRWIVMLIVTSFHFEIDSLTVDKSGGVVGEMKQKSHDDKMTMTIAFSKNYCIDVG